MAVRKVWSVGLNHVQEVEVDQVQEEEVTIALVIAVAHVAQEHLESQLKLPQELVETAVLWAHM